MPTVEQIQQAVDGYVHSFNQQDRSRFTSLFANDVVQIDPVGSKPNRGVAALTAFWDGLYATVEKVDFQVLDLFIAGDEAALLFRVQQHAAESTTDVTGIDVFTVDEAGLITQIKGYTDASHIKSRAA